MPQRQNPSTKLDAEIQRAWKEACDFDGIDQSASFVVFSEDNAAAGLHNRLVEHKMMLRNSVPIGPLLRLSIR